VRVGDELEVLRPIREPIGRTSKTLAAVVAVTFMAAIGGRRLLRGPVGRGRARALVEKTRLVRHGPVSDGAVQEPLVGLVRQLRTCAGAPPGPEELESLRFWLGVYETYFAPDLRRVAFLAGHFHPAARTFNLIRAAAEVNLRIRRVRRLSSDPAAGRQLGDACRASVEWVLRLERELREAEKSGLRQVRADPSAEAQAACSDLRLQMERAGITFAGIQTFGEVGAAAFIEPSILRRCLNDMLVNAIEHGAKAAEPRIEIAISCGQRRIVVAVTDNGEGVPPEARDAIFHGKTQGKKTGGLGLTHARRAVESYSGKVLLRESIPWERTTFEIELCRVPS
jgi:signal transduction histidine kinase